MATCRSHIDADDARSWERWAAATSAAASNARRPTTVYANGLPRWRSRWSRRTPRRAWWWQRATKRLRCGNASPANESLLQSLHTAHGSPTIQPPSCGRKRRSPRLEPNLSRRSSCQRQSLRNGRSPSAVFPRWPRKRKHWKRRPRRQRRERCGWARSHPILHSSSSKGEKGPCDHGMFMIFIEPSFFNL